MRGSHQRFLLLLIKSGFESVKRPMGYSGNHPLGGVTDGFCETLGREVLQKWTLGGESLFDSRHPRAGQHRECHDGHFPKIEFFKPPYAGLRILAGAFGAKSNR